MRSPKKYDKTSRLKTDKSSPIEALPEISNAGHIEVKGINNGFTKVRTSLFKTAMKASPQSPSEQHQAYINGDLSSVLLPDMDMLYNRLQARDSYMVSSLNTTRLRH